MELLVGTSGYSYKEWKGSFYPADLPAAAMLPYYAERFRTVEINNTFYRMPTAKLLEQWGTQVPERFTFTLKAPQRITHRKSLSEAGDDIAHFAQIAAVLGARRGPLLFQLPPYARKDAAKLNDLLEALPPDALAALEFRHASWEDVEVTEQLRSRDAALCVADTDELPFRDEQTLSSASWGYVRLRRSEYDDAALQRWLDRVVASGWTRAFIYFKHEDEGKGPRFAQRFLELAAQRTAVQL